MSRLMAVAGPSKGPDRNRLKTTQSNTTSFPRKRESSVSPRLRGDLSSSNFDELAKRRHPGESRDPDWLPATETLDSGLRRNDG